VDATGVEEEMNEEPMSDTVLIMGAIEAAIRAYKDKLEERGVGIGCLPILEIEAGVVGTDLKEITQTVLWCDCGFRREE